MESKEFSLIRHGLSRSQKQMAQLLGISPKAVQSFEQGWRKIPGHVERQLLFLVYLKKAPYKSKSPCWVMRNCPVDTRSKCPAWELEAGHLCWFINGTICAGEAKEKWGEKMEICRQCEVLQKLLASGA